MQGGKCSNNEITNIVIKQGFLYVIFVISKAGANDVIIQSTKKVFEHLRYFVSKNLY